MTSRDFAYWLQGFFELDDKGLKQASYELTHKQIDTIRNHLALVFKHEIDPSYGDAKHQEELNKIHNPDSGAFEGKPGNITQEALDKIKKMKEEHDKMRQDHQYHSGGCDCHTLIRC